MIEICFTLGEGDVWHTINANIDIQNEIQTETLVAQTIGEELSKIKNHTNLLKKVVVKDEKGKIIGKSSDLRKIGQFYFIKSENDETN